MASVFGEARGDARPPDDHRDAVGRLVRHRVVPVAAVLPQALAVVGGHDHRGLLGDPEVRQLLHEDSEVVVPVGHGPVVAVDEQLEVTPRPDGVGHRLGVR